MDYNKLWKGTRNLAVVCENLPNKEELGEKALTLISDYPLYASMSNITYGEAIAIAMVLFGDFTKVEED